MRPHLQQHLVVPVTGARPLRTAYKDTFTAAYADTFIAAFSST
jgi:hypothetical protein